MTEDEMIGWHPRRNGNELGQTSGNVRDKEALACCSPWDHKESDLTWQLNNEQQHLSLSPVQLFVTHGL